MAIRFENQCCDCATPAYPCKGALCSRRRVEIHYCEGKDCGIDLEETEIYEFNGKEYCLECLGDFFRKR